MADKIKAPGSVNLSDELIAQTRYRHYIKRRMQALQILQIRYEDLKNEINYPKKKIYENDADILYDA
jgi:hypothetical protein